MIDEVKAEIVAMVTGIRTHDALGTDHRDRALRWLAGTDDIYRRVKPGTPSPHLVAYFLLVDRAAAQVLLVDHRLSGLWLPTGGHVEPGEHPVDTVRREVREELGVEAVFDPRPGTQPFLITVTDTVGAAHARHTDVSLWFALCGEVDEPLEPDAREFAGVRWWSRAELAAADASRFEPHLPRALDLLAL